LIPLDGGLVILAAGGPAMAQSQSEAIEEVLVTASRISRMRAQRASNSAWGLPNSA
jgi:hypothetical protein